MKRSLLKRRRPGRGFFSSSLFVSIGAGPFTSGSVLTANVNGLVGGEVVTYQWKDDGVNIAGATSSSYTATIGVDAVADASLISVEVIVDGGDPLTSSSRQIQYPAGSVTESALANWTIDVDVLNVNLASDFTTTNLTGSYVISGLPTGTVDDGDGTISGTVTDTSPATFNFTCVFTDQYGRTITGNYSVTTVLRAEATAAGGLLDQSYIVDTATNLDFTVDFSANGNTLTYVITGLPTGVVDDGDGTQSGTPTTPSESGTTTITATDEYGRTEQSAFNYTTALRAVATAAGNLANQSYTVDTPVSLDLTVDFTANGNTLTYVITGLPTGLVDDGDGTLSGTPTVGGESGTTTITATDEYGRTTPSSFTYTTFVASSGIGTMVIGSTFQVA